MSSTTPSWQQSLYVPPSSPQKRGRGKISSVMKSPPPMFLKPRLSFSSSHTATTASTAASEEQNINDILDECEQICNDFSHLDTNDTKSTTHAATSRRPSTASVSSSSQQGDLHFTTTSWTIEATLIRELGIRFIDARQLSTQAKLKLGVKGYPSVETKLKCVELAIEIFNAKSARDQTVMQCLKTGLDSAKQEVNVTIPDVTIKAFGSNKGRGSRKSNIRRTSASSSTSSSSAKDRRRRSSLFLREFQSPLES